MTKQEFRKKYDFLSILPKTQKYIDNKAKLYENANDPKLAQNPVVTRALSTTACYREMMRKYNGGPK